MPDYHFSLHDEGRCINELGRLPLECDAAAIAFGERVIRDLLEGNQEQLAAWMMKITERERVVSEIPVVRLKS